MLKNRLIPAGLLLGLLATATQGAVYTAQVTFTFGDVSSDGLPPGTGAPVFSPFLCATGLTTGCFSGNFDSSGDKLWAGQNPNTVDLSAGAASVIYPQSGSNGTSYYNPLSTFDPGGLQDYSAFGQPNCTTSSIVKDFSCSQLVGKDLKIFPTVVSGVGPAASGSGTLTIDTVAGTITGVINVNPFVYRSGDGSPFNASAQYIGYYSNNATLTFSLTGVFTNTSWTITGGSAAFSSPTGPGVQGSACFAGDLSGTLCNANPVLGGQDPVNFSHLGFINVPVYDQTPAAGGTLQFILPGIIGAATLIDNGDGTGSIAAASGEFRRPLGAVAAGCPTEIVWNASLNRVTCGNLTAGIWSMSGVVSPIPPLPPYAENDTATTILGQPVDIAVLDNDVLTGGVVTVAVTGGPSSGTAQVLNSPGSPADIRIRYTPNLAFSGEDSFQYSVTDGGETVSATVTVTVTFASANDDTAFTTDGLPVDIPVVANDGFGSAVLGVELFAIPLVGTAQVLGSPGGPADIRIRYTPPPGFTGTTSFQYALLDGEFVSIARVTVTVGPATASDDTASTPAGPASGQPVGINVLVNDVGFTDPVTVTVVAPPASGMAAVNGSPGPAAGVFILYTPDGGFSGQDSFVYQVSDGLRTDTATVTVTVTPKAVNDEGVTNLNTPVTLDVKANDLGFTTPPVTLAIGDPPARGTATVVGDPGIPPGQRIQYLPGVNLGGLDSFSYTISDGTGASDAAVVTVRVRPQANPDSAIVLRDTPKVLAVLANDLGLTDPVAVTVITPPAQGTAAVTGSPGPQGTVSITYTPGPGYLGQDSFQYRVEDNVGSSTATVSLIVTQDTDGDGVFDYLDNCILVPNPDQRDTDGDGYGNACDGDFDNNGLVNFTDLAIFRSRFATTDPDADLDGNGFVNFSDLAIFRSLFGRPPGPSGLVP